MKECNFCNSEVEIREKIEVFHPFDSIGTVYKLCEGCRDNLDDIYYCESCNRHIYHSNGLRINIRVINGGMECISCLQKEWLNDGMEMFSEADFFSYSDLESNGYKLYNNYFCQSNKQYDDVSIKFTELKNSGKKVICNIDSSGHIEHHISLYIKGAE